MPEIIRKIYLILTLSNFVPQANDRGIILRNFVEVSRRFLKIRPRSSSLENKIFLNTGRESLNKINFYIHTTVNFNILAFWF